MDIYIQKNMNTLPTELKYELGYYFTKIELIEKYMLSKEIQQHSKKHLKQSPLMWYKIRKYFRIWKRNPTKIKRRRCNSWQMKTPRNEILLF